jgi:DNA-binding MarR family transcriptional regulator
LREFLAISEEGARAHGLTGQQHQALLAIRAHRGPAAMSVGELAECLLIRSHSAVGLVSRLEERDLIARRESPADRRKALLELRPRGQDVVEAISIRNMGEIGRVSQVLEEIVRATRRLSRQAGRATSKDCAGP